MSFGKRRRREDDYSEYYEEVPQRRTRTNFGSASRFFPHLAGWLLIGGLFLGAAWVVAGRVMVEKTLQAIVAPCGLIWLGLLLCTYFCFIRQLRLPAMLCVIVWLLMTLAGNGLFSNWLMSTLERDYFEFDLEPLEKFDVVLLLGGGTSTAPNGKPQGSYSSDRILVAVQLYQLGKAKMFICSGTSGVPRGSGELMASEATSQLLQSLQVPPGAILQIKGRNTLEEIQALDRWLYEQERKDLRVGILTSAWHLPRALRLAGAVGVKADPIPSDFLTSAYRAAPDLLIPTATNLWKSQIALKEHLASVLGR